ncbi:MAG: Gfo/Idh/MocA family oxidoreductase [Proteobacteria bacterium]|nr:Gfo/Idh/MocA family oxidoreductase [Pseudomonadota bacterium]
MKPLRIALIGTGFMGKCHALAWRNLRAVFGAGIPDIHLEVLAESNSELAAQKAAEFGFARSTDDWRAAVNDPVVDLVSITTPNGMHREMAVAALNAGKHVWCEKPMALTLADAGVMAAAAKEAGRVTALGYNYLQNPAILTARRLIDEGAIGRIIDVRGAVDEDYLADGGKPWSWRMTLAEAGLGTLGDITCHLVSLLHYLVGPITEVAALTAVAHENRPLADGGGATGVVENDDIAHALVRFASGVGGVLQSSRVAHGRKNLIRIEIHGSLGMIVFDQERLNELQLYTADGPAETRGFRTILTGPQHAPYGLFCPAPGHQLGFNDLKVIEAANIVAAIEGRPSHLIDFASGYRIEAVIHAIACSAQEQRWLAVA